MSPGARGGAGMRIKRGRVGLDPRVLGDGARLHPETSGAVRVLKQLVRCSDTPINGVHGLRPQGRGCQKMPLSPRELTMPRKGNGHLRGTVGLGRLGGGWEQG